jgi:hypothetical protein
MIAKVLVLVTGLTLAFTSSACTPSHGGGDVQGQTHWLVTCNGDDECGELACVCGACVAPCVRGDCASEREGTECFAGGSPSVTAMCAPLEAVPLCLEPCDGECGDGQACVDGACVNEEITDRRRAAAPGGRTGGAPGVAGESAGGAGTSTGGAGDGAAAAASLGGAGDGSAGDGSAAAGGSLTDAGSAGQLLAAPFIIGLANTSDKPVVVQTAGNCSGVPTWFTLKLGGEMLNLFGGCECTDENPDFACPIPPPSCEANEYVTLEPGEELPFEWDARYSAAPAVAGQCSERPTVRSDVELELSVCWLQMEPADPFVTPPPQDYTCGTRTFVPGTDGGFWMPAVSP